MGRALHRRRLSAWSDSDYRIRQSGKDACGLEALRAPTFPLYDYDDFSTKVCTGKVGTKEQSQRRVCNLLLIMVFNDRPTYKDRCAAELILARST